MALQWRNAAAGAAGVAIAAAFVLLNRAAYSGFFTDDEFDTLSWAPTRRPIEFIRWLLSPLFSVDNFRPAGHAYFAIMGRLFGLDFPAYMTPIFAIHIANGSLIFAILRRLKVGVWQALGGAAFFVLSVGAFDAYWKPMYVFDLLCTFFCLLSVLLYAYGRFVLSFLAFWLAYKSKELAVLLPAVLAVYEYWFGTRRFLKLVPFFLASLSFGLQGILLNPNKDNEYTFRFTLAALRKTIPFYARRFLLFRLSGVALFALAFVRDRRVWFGLAGTAILITTLLFLPGRLYVAYAYLPLAFASIAIAAAAARVHPLVLWIALAIWMPFNLRELHLEKHVKLAADGEARAFVEPLMQFARANPDVDTLIYDGRPAHFQHWGVTAAWNIAHGALGQHAFFYNWPETASLLRTKRVAYAHWDGGGMLIRIHNPGAPIP